jgi:hypothetical protein
MRTIILVFLCISVKGFSCDIDTLPGLKISNAAAGSDGIVLRCGATMTMTDQPLYIIDGVPADRFDLGKINTSDILRVDILKASAATLLGCRAIGGVIIITTKRNNRLVILDADNKRPLQGATVNIQSNKQLKQWVILVADKNGEIDLGSLDPMEEHSIEISCIGYQTRIITTSKAGFDHSIEMQKKYDSMDSVFIFSNEYTTRKVCCICCSVRVDQYLNRKDIATPILFSLYPNPASSAGAVTLKLLQPVHGKANLINVSGQIVQTIKLDQENPNSVIQLNNAKPGCYFVRISDNKSQKVITQKLIVQ